MDLDRPRVLHERYELGEVLGSGGMGVVHRARDLVLDRPVAVKLLRVGVADEETQRARLRAEAHLAGGLSHPGIAGIYDYVEDQQEPDSPPFLVMELVEGAPLSLLLAEGPLSPERTADIVAQVADALAAAHGRGIVHRDIKPSNILLTEDGHAVLVDFGIATSPGLEPLTSTGSLIGTADYVSPEQAAGRPATPSSDLYSLGLVAYQCLTGRSPFHRETSIATALAQVNEPLPDLPAAVPGPLGTLVRDLTRKDPLDRPASAAEVAARARGELEVAPHDPVTTVLARPIPAPVDVRWWESSRRRAAAVACLLVAAVVGVFGVSAFGDGSPKALPDVVGMSVDAATDRLESEGVLARQETVDDPRAAEGTVLAQDPAPGTEGADTVTLTVASGLADVTHGELLGRDYATVAAALEQRGLRVSQTVVEQAEGAGTVVALSETGRVPIGTEVTVTVAVAPPPPVVTAPSTSESAQRDNSSNADQRGSRGSGQGKND